MKTTREEINKYLHRLKCGEDCVEDFIDYSRGYIKYIAYKYVFDKSLIEDVIYSAYEKILQHIDAFDKSQNGLAWIVRIAQNEAYRFNKGSRSAYHTTELEENSSVSDFDESGVMDKYDLERAISRLDEQERRVVEYKVFMGMTFREIAQEMNIPKSTAAYVFKNALKKLEKFLS